MAETTSIKEKETALVEGQSGEWTVILQKIHFRGDEHYIVATVKITSTGETCKITGSIEDAFEEMELVIQGNVVRHAKYGLQINCTSYRSNIDEKYAAAIAFISSGAVNGIGPATARKLIKRYGDKYVAALQSVPQLEEFGFSKAKATQVTSSYLENHALFAIFEATNGNITYNQALKIHDTYGSKAKQIVTTNPYKLIYDIRGFGFRIVDAIALRSGFATDSLERIKAAMNYCLSATAKDEGHCYVEKGDLVASVADLILSVNELKVIFYHDVLHELIIPKEGAWEETTLSQLVSGHVKRVENILSSWDDPVARNKNIKKEKFTNEELEALNILYNQRLDLHEKMTTIIHRDGYDISDVSLDDAMRRLYMSDADGISFVLYRNTYGKINVCLKNTFLREAKIADLLTNMLKQGVLLSLSDDTIATAMQEIEAEQGNNFRFDADQIEAVRLSLLNRVSVITGGPGRGKTTIIRAAIRTWKNAGTADAPTNVVLLAPTGKAAKRMTESTGYPASTIQRYLLSLQRRRTVLEARTLVFVDEMSMTDLPLMDNLMNLLSDAQLCFVGDVDQLPSVGEGNILADLIASDVIPFVRLERCHRNAGSIFYNSTVINRGGRIQELVNDAHFRTLWVQDSNAKVKNKKIVDNILNIYRNNLPKYGAENMIVLTPMQERTTGVLALNEALQKIANPQDGNKSEYSYTTNNGTRLFREGDRVIQTVNNYQRYVEKDGISDTGVFNGEIGTITTIDHDANQMTVTFDDGKLGFYEFNSLNEITLAYAMTYHKSQGSEFQFVICALSTADFLLLQRRILYTGESRAKDMCVFVGEAKAFYMAISNFKNDDVRRTSLKKYLQAYASGRA